ncbi:unnamed protein product [Prunus brigantina]
MDPVVGLWREDKLGSNLGEKPLDGVVVESVTQLMGQPKNTEATIEDIPIPEEARCNIVMDMLRVRHGLEIQGLGYGTFRDVGSSSSQGQAA